MPRKPTVKPAKPHRTELRLDAETLDRIARIQAARPELTSRVSVIRYACRIAEQQQAK